MALNKNPTTTTTLPAAMETSAGTSQSSTGNSDPKSNRILRQGVYQHALVSPALAGMQYKNEEEFVALVERVAEKIIKKIEG